MTKPVPEGYHSVTPHLVFEDTAAAIQFYEKAFGAVEVYRLPMGKKTAHAELQIGDSRIMMADANPMWQTRSAEHYQGSPVSLMIYVPDVDASAERALAAGATVVRPVRNQFYGDRSGAFLDPFGYIWTLATHVEDVSPEEIASRFAGMA